jgi:hypothetical protein
MQWSTVDCTNCGACCIVPPDCAKRVTEGTSFVFCETCGDNPELVSRATASAGGVAHP